MIARGIDISSKNCNKSCAPGCTSRFFVASDSISAMVSSAKETLEKEPLVKPITVQLAVSGSRTKVTYGTTVSFEYQEIKEDRYFDIMNINSYDLVLETPFLF